MKNRNLHLYLYTIRHPAQALGNFSKLSNGFWIAELQSVGFLLLMTTQPISVVGVMLLPASTVPPITVPELM